VRELTLHLLDIAENSVSAGAQNVSLSIVENTKTDLLKMMIKDDGRGMDAEMVQKVMDPFVTTRTTRKVGLGIPLLKAAAEASNGNLTIASKPGQGTTLEVTFQRSHIDRMPLGDVKGTFLNLLIANPQIHWIFEYTFDEKSFLLDDKEIKQELKDVTLTEPAVLSCLREIIDSGIAEVRIVNQ
jgi:anti-sigma regulatory factor (Ser/Thr protein kinase)